MPELIVDTFEVVDIDHETTYFGSVSSTLGKCLFKLREEGAPVETGGERITGGQPL